MYTCVCLCAHPMTWVLRVQWVKFMLCSGVVKVTADCPTWKHLTALEFHFASTCLPTVRLRQGSSDGSLAEA